MCPLVANAISDLNPQLKTLNGKNNIHETYLAVVTDALNVWVTFCFAAVLAKVDKFAEIEYSMVASPTVSQSAIDLSLKVKSFASFPYTFKLWKLNVMIDYHCIYFLSFRVNFTTLGAIRSLRSPLHPSPCRLRSTTCCTSACPPSLSTLLASSTTELESSAWTSPTTWSVLGEATSLQWKSLNHSKIYHSQKSVFS